MRSNVMFALFPIAADLHDSPRGLWILILVYRCSEELREEVERRSEGPNSISNPQLHLCRCWCCWNRTTLNIPNQEPQAIKSFPLNLEIRNRVNGADIFVLQ
jgi:hypothetical protein